MPKVEVRPLLTHMRGCPEERGVEEVLHDIAPNTGLPMAVYRCLQCGEQTTQTLTVAQYQDRLQAAKEPVNG